MNHYQSEYFEQGIFSTDYAFLARIIFTNYKPLKVIEFGCGPGHLTRELAKLNIEVTAIDGFSDPDFSKYPMIQFLKLDLNNEEEVANFIYDKQYDLAICTEVAEHLLPSSSTHLIKNLTQCSQGVIFSAAVPGQNGHGHINCQSRLFWHQLFRKNGFQIADSLRKHLQSNMELAIWYRLNVIDYRIEKHSLIDKNDVIDNLISSESYSSSLFYKKNTENEINKAYLQYPLVRLYFNSRTLIKKILKRKNG